MRTDRNTKPNWIFRTGAILLLLVLATTCLLSGLLARYRSGAGGSDSARVARFEIETAGDLYTEQFILEMLPGDALECSTMQIVNKSETAVRCTPKVETTGNLPLTFTWCDENGAEVSATDLAYNGGTATLTLEVSWPDTDDSYLYHREIEHVTVVVSCDQID